MLDDFQDIFVFSLTVREVFGNVTVALACGLIISVIYRASYQGLNYSATFVNSLVLLTMITAVVIMVIGNNLARAFGLVGAMSIIRFRTAVKDTQDIMFIFFALAIGLAAGVGLYAVAMVGTAFIGSIALIFSRLNYGRPPKREFLLQLNVFGDRDGEIPYGPILNRYCKSHKMVNVKALGAEGTDHLELSFYVNLKKEEHSDEFIRALKNLPGVQQVNLFFDEE